MKDSTRAAIAAVAYSALAHKRVTHVHDYSLSAKRKIEASFDGRNVKAHDHDRSCAIEGEFPGDVYHYGDSHFVEMKPHGSGIEGYDYDTSTFFEVSITGNEVEIYDYGTSRFHSYEVE